MFRNLSLQNRILILVTAVTVALTSVIVWFDSYSLQKSVEETYASQLDGMTTAINGRYEESHNFQDVQQIFDYIQYKNHNVLELTLYGSGKVLAATERERVGQAAPPEMRDELRESGSMAVRFENVPGTHTARLTAPLKEDGVTIGAIELVLNTSDSVALIHSRIRTIVFVGLSITLLLLVSLYFINRKFLILPLLKIREAAISVRKGGTYRESGAN